MANYISNFAQSFTAALRFIITKLTKNYYTKLHKLPLSRWFEAQAGDMTAFYRWFRFGKAPKFFDNIAEDMIYQFDHLDLTAIRLESEVLMLRIDAENIEDKTRKNIKLNQSRIKQVELDKLLNEKQKAKNITLNQFLNFIEQTFDNIGTIDPEKISTKRAFSLYWLAIDTNNKRKAEAEKSKA